MTRPVTTDLEAARSLASRILVTCGHSRILNVGCAGGALVQALLEQGCDAHGVDTKKPSIKSGVASSRYSVGSVQRLPFRKNSFDNVVVTYCLEELDEANLRHALRELRRVAQGSVLIFVRGGKDLRTGASSSTRGRQAWEMLFLAHGFRKSLLYLWLQDFESLEKDPDEILISFEKLPAAVVRQHPLDSLSAHRDLHMDMLRESGRRSEAHLARYHLASQFVRKNDRVLDAACGLGYGSAMLRAGTLAASVTGLDAAMSAIAYARVCYGGLFEQLDFCHATLPMLARWEDNSLDLVVSFETVEHLADPKSFLAEIDRVLTPGGRFICSVPNRWVDESGKDPNPHHRHVFDFQKIRKLVSTHFLIERMVAQTAGGGMILANEPRRMRALDDSQLDSDAPPDDMPAEWWLMVGMKSPCQKPLPRYEERLFPEGGANPPHYLSFGRDYANPWLVRSMVTIGSRASSSRVLERIAQDALKSAPARSPDQGAALCVLLYRQLAHGKIRGRDTTRFCRLAEAYTRNSRPASPHTVRWKISLQFVLGLIETRAGAFPKAIRQLELCARAECREFSHLLATKSVRAAHLAAVLQLAQGNALEAQRLWQLGLATAFRVFSDTLQQAVGNLKSPPDFALRELTQVLDFAQQCAVAINVESRAPGQRALFSRLINECLTDDIVRARQSLHQCQEWNQKLSDANDWQAAQNKSLAAQLKEAAPRATAQKLWISKLKDGNSWMEKQLAVLKPRQAELLTRHEQMRAWIAKLLEAKRWLEGQNSTLAANLKSTQTRLADATRWFEGQVAAAKAETADLRRQLAEFREFTQVPQTESPSLPAAPVKKA